MKVSIGASQHMQEDVKVCRLILRMQSITYIACIRALQMMR